MLFFEFVLLIFQDGVFSEELEVTQEFRDLAHLTETLIAFAAQQSPVRFDAHVQHLWTRRSSLTLPPTREGYGPKTAVVVKSATQRV